MDKKRSLPSWLPYVVGGLLVAQFAALGAWQVSRGLEKRETEQLFAAESSHSEWRHGDSLRPFQRIRVRGEYDERHQIVLDNILINSRLGHYVITPLELDDDQPLLLVNRGWIEKSVYRTDAMQIDAEPIEVRGRAGSLPRAGYKMGEAFSPSSNWPRHAVYPSLEDVAAELGRPVQPFVLLLAPDEANGFHRHWVVSGFGPGKHFGYALQWFAMGAVLMGLLIWNFRRKKRG